MQEGQKQKTFFPLGGSNPRPLDPKPSVLPITPRELLLLGNCWVLKYISFSRLGGLRTFLISADFWLAAEFFFSICIAWLWLVESLTLRWKEGQSLGPKVKVEEKILKNWGDCFSHEEGRKCMNFQRILPLIYFLDSRQLSGTTGS